MVAAKEMGGAERGAVGWEGEERADVGWQGAATEAVGWEGAGRAAWGWEGAARREEQVCTHRKATICRPWMSTYTPYG